MYTPFPYMYTPYLIFLHIHPPKLGHANLIRPFKWRILLYES